LIPFITVLWTKQSVSSIKVFTFGWLFQFCCVSFTPRMVIQDRDVLQIVFSFIPLSSWFNVMCTCKLWNEIGRQVFDPRARRDALLVPIRNNNLICLRALLKDKRVDPAANENEAFLLACRSSRTGIVKELLQDKRVDPSADSNFAIRWASFEGETEIVKALLKDKRVDPSAMNNAAIQWASEEGHFEVVQELLKHKDVDPAVDFCNPIRSAAKHKHKNIVLLLSKDPRCMSYKKTLRDILQFNT
jgi:hypothetical protein